MTGPAAGAVGLSRALPAAGVATGPDRTQLFPGALDPLDPARRTDVYWAGRLTLCGSRDELCHRAPVTKPRRVVLLLDVSGSLDPYADALLRFAHAAAHGPAARTPTEVFTIGTRLTRVTREMAHRDPDTALAAVAAAVPDRGGGTRLGEMPRTFLDRWGQRSCARGAVVVVRSDGWERADPALLAARMCRLHRLAYRVVWANPRKAQPGYAPFAAGMAAALPHMDAFVEGHRLAALERLAAVVRGVASDA